MQDESFHITGIGTVVSGTVTAGRISVHDEMLFGACIQHRYSNCDALIFNA